MSVRDILENAAVQLGMPYPVNALREEYSAREKRFYAMKKTADSGHLFAIEAMSWMGFMWITSKERLKYIRQYVRLSTDIDRFGKVWDCVLNEIQDVDAGFPQDEEMAYDLGNLLDTYYQRHYDLNSMVRVLALQAYNKTEATKAAVVAWCWLAKHQLKFYPDLVRLVGEYVWSGRKTWENLE